MSRVYIFIVLSFLLHLLLWVGMPRIEQKVALRGDRLFLEFKSLARTGADNSNVVRQSLRSQSVHQKELAQRRLDSRVQSILRYSVVNLSKIERTESEMGVADEDLQGERSLQGAGAIRAKVLPLVWKQIRANVGYRSEHFRSRIEGDVTIRVRINKYGKLLRIMEEDATGNHHLQGWVILCLMKALERPFLDKPLDANQLLELRFQFSLGRSVDSDVLNSQRMVFAIVGDLPVGGLFTGKVPKIIGRESANSMVDEVTLLTVSTARIKNLFEDKTIRNQIEWSFYEQEEKLLQSCEVSKNLSACSELANIYKKIGNIAKAKHFDDIAKYLK